MPLISSRAGRPTPPAGPTLSMLTGTPRSGALPGERAAGCARLVSAVNALPRVSRGMLLGTSLPVLPWARVLLPLARRSSGPARSLLTAWTPKGSPRAPGAGRTGMTWVPDPSRPAVRMTSPLPPMMPPGGRECARPLVHADKVIRRLELRRRRRLRATERSPRTRMPRLVLAGAELSRPWK